MTDVAVIRETNDNEVDFQSPLSEEIMMVAFRDAIREVEDLVVSNGRGLLVGVVDADPPDQANSYIEDADPTVGSINRADKFNGLTLLMLDGDAEGNLYKITDTDATNKRIVVAENLYDEGVREGDSYQVLGHRHDEIDSLAAVVSANIAKSLHTSSGTFTPTKTGTYKVTVVGGGGQGGGNGSSYHAGGGGGACAIKFLTLTAGVNYTVTIGAGGTSQSNQNSAGSSGSDSSFAGSGITTITAGGGGGGSTQGVGGAGGSASNGDININGGKGSGTSTNSLGTSGAAGAGLTRGGSSPFGTEGDQSTTPGGYGHGGWNSLGYGGNGMVLVEWVA